MGRQRSDATIDIIALCLGATLNPGVNRATKISAPMSLIFRSGPVILPNDNSVPSTPNVSLNAHAPQTAQSSACPSTFQSFIQIPQVYV